MMWLNLDVPLDDGVGSAPLLVPVPPTTWHQVCSHMEVRGADASAPIATEGSGQQALCLRPTGSGPISITFHMRDGDGAAPDWLWHLADNRCTVPSAALASLARGIAQTADDTQSAIQALVREAEQRFTYDHPLPEARFNYGQDRIPVVSCGLTPGSCVDINTWLIGAFRAIGVRVAYLAGHFFPDGTDTIETGGHCWLATEAEPGLQFWDVAHHLRFGLGPTRPALNPQSGHRITLSAGRGLRFDVGDGLRVALDHFYDPYWLGLDGPVRARIRSSVGVEPAEAAVPTARASKCLGVARWPDEASTP